MPPKIHTAMVTVSMFLSPPLTSMVPASIFLLVLMCVFPLIGLAQQLKVSENGHFLEYQNGDPFFWLGDTAWELFHRLDRKEAALYLENRAEKGFTVIQAVVLAEFDGLHTPNAYGDTPLTEDDPTRPNEAYFKHVDYIVRKASRLGLFIGMLPTWGDKVRSEEHTSVLQSLMRISYAVFCLKKKKLNTR